MIWTKNIFSRDRVFALLSLLSIRGHAISGNGTCYGVTRNTPLTTNHLPRKANPWLSLSVPNPLSAPTSFPRQKARSLPMWSFQFLPITTSSKLCFRTRPHSVSTWSRASKSCPNSSIGNRANTNPLNAGDLFTAFSPFTT
jgi:hypothetical protein